MAKKSRLKRQTWILVAAEFLLLIYGYLLVPAASVERHPLYYGRSIIEDSVVRYVAVVNDIPQQRPRSLKCQLKLLAIVRHHSVIPVHGEIIGYFRNCERSSLLKPNTVVEVSSKFTTVPAAANPGQFDYSAYLKNKQISHVTFIDSTAFLLPPVFYNSSYLWQFGLKCKQYVLRSLKNGGLSPDAYGICAALLTGYDADIDDDIMQSFSHSGTLHVLSVSGLHTGLIYLILSFLFDLADRNKNRKLLKFLFITFFLWGFALLAGFSAPVLRAVIMFNLLGFGKIYFRSGARHQVNILCVSAFILLNINPYLIRDVGFLLSYFAMAGLFCFQPPLSALWIPNNQFSMYCWQSITASFAATLSTLPITLFFFKQFPIWFFVCNLVVVPVTFLLLLLAFLVVVKLKFFALVINKTVSWLILFIDFFDSKRYGYIDQIHFTFIDLCMMSVIIILVSYMLLFRSYRLCRLTLIVLIGWQSFSLGQSYLCKTSKLFSVYQVNRCRALSLKNCQETYIDLQDTSQFNFQVKPHIISFNYPRVTNALFNYVSFTGTGIMMIDGSGAWNGGTMHEIQVLVISNNFSLSEQLFYNFPSLQQLVVDGSNNTKTLKKAGDLCRKLGVRLHDTRKDGAYLLTLK